MIDDLADVGTPHCPEHLEPLMVVGWVDLEGRDARWVCPVEGCTYVALSN